MVEVYRADYDEVLVKGLPSIYHVVDSWDHYEKMKQRINLRFQDWRKLTGN
jgi:predicted glycosyltransferase